VLSNLAFSTSGHTWDADVNLGAYNLTTTGTGTFGELLTKYSGTQYTLMKDIGLYDRTSGVDTLSIDVIGRGGYDSNGNMAFRWDNTSGELRNSAGNPYLTSSAWVDTATSDLDMAGYDIHDAGDIDGGAAADPTWTCGGSGGSGGSGKFIVTNNAGSTNPFIEINGAYGVMAFNLGSNISGNGPHLVMREANNHELMDLQGRILTDSSIGLQIATSSSEKLGFWGATTVAQDTSWSVSNESTTKTFDADSTTVNELADVLGTLIETLKTYGILGS
jgi:hypothetical protein